MPDVLFLVLAVATIAGLVYLAFSFWRQLSHLRRRFAPVIDLDEEIEELKMERAKLQETVSKSRARWSAEYRETVAALDDLTKQLDQARDAVEMQSFGLYEPMFDYETPDEYKETLLRHRKQVKQMVKDGKAAVSHTQWEVQGSKRKGQVLTNRYLKLMLRAFNGEVDTAIAKVKYNNVDRLIDRLHRSRDTINKLATSQNAEITQTYLAARIRELRLSHEYELAKYEEREEQRAIREQMREEERVQKEIERAKKEAERDEKRYQQALDKARRDLEGAHGEEQGKLADRIAELEAQLQESQDSKERALSRAQLTKSGHVYVLSNVGSFGDRVYKIGMTRRLDPADRVRELGDASVPFPFDVHALIYAENAPELENALHKAFDHARLNLVNLRREYFYVALEDIERVVGEFDAEVQFTRAAEAAQFRQSQVIRSQRSEEGKPKVDQVVEAAKSRFEQLRERWATAETV